MTTTQTRPRGASVERGRDGFPPADPAEFKGKRVMMLLYLSTTAHLPPMHHEAVSLARHGAEVIAVCWTTDPDAPPEEILAPGFLLRRFKFRSLRFFIDRFGLSPSNVFRAATQYLVTYAEFVLRGFVMGVQARADLYEAHDLPTLLPVYLASRVRRKPLVYRAHELYPEMHEKVKFAGLWKFLERLLVPRADIVITPETNRSAIYLNEYHARSAPLTVMNCPPFQEPIASTKIRDVLAERGVSAATVVLYQGLLDNSRCIRELVDAAEYFDKGIILVLMGGGFAEWKNPEKIVGGRRNIVVLPRVDYHDLALYTASADIGVMFYRNNCRNNYYCAPNKVAEYMMMGLPMVTVNYPGIRALVEAEGIGLCVNPEDPKAIAGAINRLARDREFFSRAKANCLRRARERYNWENEFQTIRSAYHTLLAEQEGVSKVTA